MKAWMCAFGLALSVAAPAVAQKTDLPDRPAKRTSEFDFTAIREVNAVLQASGMCNVQFVVTASAELSDMSIDCTHPEMVPAIEKTMRAATWEAEIEDGEFFDSFPKREAFKYGAAPPAVDPRGEKPPIMEDGLVPRDITRAIAEVNEEGSCDVKFTVGANGKPKDIQPNCTPAAYNDKIIAAMGRMSYTPAQKGGQATDWPGLSMPLKLTKPKGT